MINSKKRKVRRKKKVKNLNQRLFLVFLIILLLVSISFVFRSCNRFEYREPSKDKTIEKSQYNPNNITSGNGIIEYKDKKYKSRLGIDVSEHQEEIDWKAVKDDGIEFAIIRMGYSGWHSGNIVKDAYFDFNISAAKKEGIDIGVYFFSQASTIEEAIKEAEYVANTLGNTNLQLPVFFDMEPLDGKERTANLSKELKTQIADAFCQCIKSKGFDAGVYGNPTWFDNSMDLSYLQDYTIWLAYYTGYNDFPYKYSFWQFTDKGMVNGINSNVDLNIQFVKRGWV